MRTFRAPRLAALAAVAITTWSACSSTVTVHVPAGPPTTSQPPTAGASPTTGEAPATTAPIAADPAAAERLLGAVEPVAVDAPCPPPLPATARCGTVALPADWTDPDGDTLDIWFARVPAASGASTGTTLPLMGGPGEAISAVADLFLPFVDLLPDRDLLLVDVRGTGRSGRLACPTVDALRWIPDGPDQVATAACGRELGEQLDDYTTVATALDLEAVRRTLGLDDPSVIGFSYGTYLGQVYTVLFPEVVRALVLDGVMPLDLDPWGTPHTDAFGPVLALQCERVVGCDPADVEADIGAVAAQLRARPVPFPDADGRLLREGTLAYVTLFALQDRPAEYVAALASAADGDHAPLLRLAGESGALPPADPLGASIALSPVVQCNDYTAPFSLESDIATRRAEYDSALAALPDDQFGWFTKAGWMESGWEQGDFCLEWPDPQLPAELRVPLDGPYPDVPVLVLNGDVDLQTPLAAARDAAAAWQRHALVVIAGAGHPTLPVSACAYDLAVEVLHSGELPADDACASSPVVG